jgi:ketosteroid isomerase-like protein
MNLSTTDQHTRVDARVEAFIAALLKPERDTLRKLTSPALSYGHSNGRVENREQFIRNMLAGGSRFLSIELSEQTLQVAGDVAVARHILFARTHDTGKEPGTIRIGILLVWHYARGEWLLLARQAFKLPQS